MILVLANQQDLCWKQDFLFPTLFSEIVFLISNLVTTKEKTTPNPTKKCIVVFTNSRDEMNLNKFWSITHTKIELFAALQITICHVADYMLDWMD